MFEEFTAEKKPPLPPPPPEEKPTPKVEVEKEKEESTRDRDSLDSLSTKEEIPIRQVKDRDKYTRPPYGSSRTDYPTPNSSDMGYGTQSETYSTNYGSTNTTPLG